MSSSTLAKQNLTTGQAIGIAAGFIMTILIIAIIGVLSVLYCFVLKKKKSKLTDIVVDNINITSEEITTVVPRNRINSTTPLYNDSTNFKKVQDNYGMNNKVVPGYNS